MENELTLNVGTKGADEAAAKVRGITNNLSDTAKESSGLGDKLNKAALAIGAAGVGLTAYSKSATNAYTDYVKSVNGIARITGESVEQTSKLQYVFQRSGIAADQTASVFGIFSKQIAKTNDAAKDGAAAHAELQNKIDGAKIKIAQLTAEAKKNGDADGDIKNQIEGLNISIDGYTKKMTDAVTPLQKLGVATQDATGKNRSFSDILLDVADKFKAMPNGAEKTADAMALFGKSGKNMLPVLNKGSDGIKDLEAQADKLGLTLSSKNVEAVSKYTEVQKKLKDAHSAFTLAVGTEALPMWAALANAQLKATEMFDKAPEPIKKTVSAIAAFGGPVATATASVVGFAANVSSVDWGKIGGDIKGVGSTIKGIGPVASTVASTMSMNVRVMALYGIESAKAAAASTVAVVKNTGAVIANGAAVVLAGIRWAALKAVQLGIIIATNLWAAAQWALNVALNANPIALIIIAVAALIAGIILLYTHSQTFRNIVSEAFNFVWGIIQGVWNWIAANWPLLLAILTGPIGIAVYMIVTHWETIKAAFALAWQFIQAVWSGVAGWFAGVWQGIVNVFAGVVGWFGGVFAGAWQAIRNVFAGVGGFFAGLWNTIVSVMGSIGSTVANVISGAVKGVVNGILSGAEGIINGFINSINAVVGTINKIPGVNIGKLGQFHLPRLAEGGIVQARPGGTAVIAGEAGQDEAVIPLNKLQGMLNGNGSTNNFYGTINLNSKEAVDEFFARLDQRQRLANLGVPI